MKKRAKIITTVASLCLAVALMAFGVYAATQVTLTVSSQVKFEVTDIFVDVVGYAQLGNAEGAGNHVGDQDYAYQSYQVVEGQKVAYDSNVAASETWTVDDITYTSANNVVTYTLTIHNVSAQDSVYVILDLEMANVAGTYRKAVSYGWDSTAGSGAGAYDATPAALSSHTAEEHYSSLASDWDDIDDVFEIAHGEWLKIVLVRTLEDTATTLSLTDSLTGTITMQKVNPNPNNG